MAQFKDLFTELRRDTGLSQEDFAALFHQSGSTISSYETGRNQPSFDMLIQYADYFNVTTDYTLKNNWPTLGIQIPFSLRMRSNGSLSFPLVFHASLTVSVRRH